MQIRYISNLISDIWVRIHWNVSRWLTDQNVADKELNKRWHSQCNEQVRAQVTFNSSVNLEPFCSEHTQLGSDWKCSVNLTLLLHTLETILGYFSSSVAGFRLLYQVFVQCDSNWVDVEKISILGWIVELKSYSHHDLFSGIFHSVSSNQ